MTCLLLKLECCFCNKRCYLQYHINDGPEWNMELSIPMERYYRHYSTCRALKELCHVTVNKPVISIIYIVVHTWPLYSEQILVDGVDLLESSFQKSTNTSAIVPHVMSVSFVSLQSSRVHLQSSIVILRNTVEDFCDTAYRKYCKIVISKEACLHHVTLPV